MKKKIISLTSQSFCIYSGELTGKPVLLCVHGGMGLSSDSLMPSLGVLSTHFDLVFMDQRGHGDSDAPKDGNYLLENFSKDIHEVIGIFGSDRVRGIFGHSLGGMIAIQTVSDYPELFKFVILSNTTLDSSWQGYAHHALSLLDQDALKLSELRYTQNSSDVTLRELAITYAPIYFPELPADKATHEMWKFSYRDASTKFLNQNIYPKIDLAEVAAHISVPVLVIAGGNDLIIPSSCQQKLKSTIPNALFVEVKNAGHFPFITQSENFKSYVSNWWKEVSHSIMSAEVRK